MFNSESPLPAPRQHRSKATLERILEVAEDLLSERVFESLTMAEVARQAGVSVGVIYTRFRTKSELLPALLQRHHQAVDGRLEGLFRSLAESRSLLERLGALVGFTVDYHVRHRGLLRALAIHVQTHPDSVPARVFRDRRRQYRAVAAALAGDGREVRHERSGQALEFALATINAICREQILFEETTLVTRSLKRLKAELVRMTYHYLTRPDRP